MSIVGCRQGFGGLLDGLTSSASEQMVHILLMDSLRTYTSTPLSSSDSSKRCVHDGCCGDHNSSSVTKSQAEYIRSIAPYLNLLWAAKTFVLLCWRHSCLLSIAKSRLGCNGFGIIIDCPLLFCTLSYQNAKSCAGPYPDFRIRSIR